MRHVFHDHLELDQRQEKLLEYHSLLNLFNILELQLSTLAMELTDPDISRYSRFCLDILMQLPEMEIREQIPAIRANCHAMRGKLVLLRQQHPELDKILDGLIETTNVGHDRIEEFESQTADWKHVSPDSIKATLRSFLNATSTVSGDRFTFSFSPEPPRAKTYWVDFRIDSETEEIWIPQALNDSIRDLASNSRKYSEPGSSIRIRLKSAADRHLTLTVLDEGIGIPRDEIPAVVKFGYRATNTLDRRTMGSGIGLTKAYMLCKKYNGSFMIESEPGKGTLVEFTLLPPI